MPDLQIFPISGWRRARAPIGLAIIRLFALLAATTLSLAQFAHADGSSAEPALTQAQLQAGVNSYMAQIPGLLAQTDARLSPDAGRASGKALVALQLASDGRVLGTKISQSSGNPLIDEFAVEDVRSAHYPAFNAAMPYKSLTLTIPITVMPPPPATPSYAPNASGMDSAVGGVGGVQP
jgi:TonB family protein